VSRRPEPSRFLYRFEPGWTADRIENVAPENLLVWEGDLTVGGHVLTTHSYAYRPPGYEVGPCSSPNGAVVISYAGAPRETLCSPNPVHSLDTDAMPWEPYLTEAGTTRYWVNMLRGDEENLEVFFLLKGRGSPEDETRPYVPPASIAAHDGPEEGFFLEGRAALYDGNLDAPVICTRGSFVHRGPYSKHRMCGMYEDQVTFSHDFFSPENEEESAAWLSAYTVETPAVKALREGRNPGPPKRW
jgi:hypothetical protein